MVDLGFVDPVFIGILLHELAGEALKGDVGGQPQVLPNQVIFDLPMTLAENGLASNEGLQNVRIMRQ